MPFDPPRATDVVSVRPSGGDDTQYLRDAIAYCFGPPSDPHGGGIGSCANKTLYFSPGQYRITDTLDLTGLQGARIMGAGRMSVRVEQETTGKSVFRTNGCQYSVFEGLMLHAGAGGVCFDLDYDGTGSHLVALQSNTFRDMMFLGGDFGVRIAIAGFMGSENLFQNCGFEGHAVAGLATSCFNALQQTVIGGNFQGCGVGILMNLGSVPVIHGVGFQQQSECDIKTLGGVETIAIAGCRSESKNFLWTNTHASIASCLHTGPADGVFVNNHNSQQVVIEACVSTEGSVVSNGWPQMRISNSAFGRGPNLTDWLSLELNEGSNVELENVSWGSIYSFLGTHIRRRRIFADATGTHSAEYAMVAL